ncbi:MAG TPA: MFS transporter [Candidatus Dormibacteraeota bacterium]|nr:MFS transporter [Candidatus Dormibacteraeota bacterium]
MLNKTMTYTEFLDEAPMSGFLWLLLVGVLIAQILDGMDYQSTAYALPLLIRQFHLSSVQAGTISSASNIGLLVGAFVFSILSDRLGRRPIFMWIIGTYAFGTFLSAIAPNYATMLVARGIAGFGIGAEFPIAFALLAEYSPVRYRHIFIPLGPACYSAGWIVAALLSLWLIPSFGWRSIYWVGVLPALMIVYVRQFLPESVRFLMLRGRVEEAGRVARAIADRVGLRDVELVPPTASSSPGTGQAQRALILRTSLPGMVALSLVYFFYFIQSFGINSWLPTIFVRQGYTLVRSFTYVLIITAFTPIAQLLGAWLQDWVNRKYALLLTTSLGAVFFILFGLSFQLRSPIGLTVAFQSLQSLLGGGVIAVLYTLGTELFPTSVRSLGMGIVTAFGRIGAIIGPFALGVFLFFGTAISHIVYFFTIPLVIASLLGLFLIQVDPRRKSLERIT